MALDPGEIARAVKVADLDGLVTSNNGVCRAQTEHPLVAEFYRCGASCTPGPLRDLICVHGPIFPGTTGSVDARVLDLCPNQSTASKGGPAGFPPAGPTTT